MQDEPIDEFLVREEVAEEAEDARAAWIPTFDLLLYVKHLRHVPTLARVLPDLPMVIDHLAKPRIKDHATDDWLTSFREAATFPNVYALSGMVTRRTGKPGRPTTSAAPAWKTAARSFGPDRLMFGSDWPVCELAAGYGQVRRALVEALGPISKPEQSAIFGGTAARFYRLPED